MYKSFKFVLLNESFPNPVRFQIRPNFCRSRISAGFVKKARFQPEPELNSGTALVYIQYAEHIRCGFLSYHVMTYWLRLSVNLFHLADIVMYETGNLHVIGQHTCIFAAFYVRRHCHRYKCVYIVSFLKHKYKIIYENKDVVCLYRRWRCRMYADLCQGKNYTTSFRLTPTLEFRHERSKFSAVMLS